MVRGCQAWNLVVLHADRCSAIHKTIQLKGSPRDVWPNIQHALHECWLWTVWATNGEPRRNFGGSNNGSGSPERAYVTRLSRDEKSNGSTYTIVITSVPNYFQVQTYTTNQPECACYNDYARLSKMGVIQTAKAQPQWCRYTISAQLPEESQMVTKQKHQL